MHFEVMFDHGAVGHMAPLRRWVRERNVQVSPLPASAMRLDDRRAGVDQYLLNGTELVELADVADSVAGEWTRTVDLTADFVCAARQGAFVQILVEEGDYLYPIAAKALGWGAATGGTRRARVLVVERLPLPQPPLLLGEAEIRTLPTHPDKNARRLVEAALGLLAQGCLGRKGRPLARPLVLSAPPDDLGARGLLFLRKARRSLAWRLRPSRKLQWNIGIGRVPQEFASPSQFNAGRVNWMTPPTDGFIADPFLVRHASQYFLFYEQLIDYESKGTIWAGELEVCSRRLYNQRCVLSKKFHLSFPNVFSEAGQWYMLPEQAQSGGTMLYRAEKFPDEWVEDRALLPNFPGIDPVLLNTRGHWWLFITFGDHAYPCSDNNLYLFYSDSLKGEWIPHKQNPIKSGLDGSRMAGPIIIDNEKFIRLGQDCREGYGMGIVLYEITDLTKASYNEREIARWSVDSLSGYGHGFHHFSSSDGVCAIDGQRRI